MNFYFEKEFYLIIVIFYLRFALTESGDIFEFCPYTGLMSAIDSSEKIHDNIITATENDGIEILALTEESPTSKFLKVFDYSSE